MKTKSKISGYIIRSAACAVFLSVAFIAASSAFNSPNEWHKSAGATVGYGSMAKSPSQPRALSFAERVAYQRAIEDVYWRHRIWPNDESRSQAIARRGDVSGADRKESRRIICATRRRWRITGKGRSLLSNCKPRWSAWPVTQNSRKSCGNCLRLLGTIPLSSRSVWPDQY